MGLLTDFESTMSYVDNYVSPLNAQQGANIYSHLTSAISKFLAGDTQTSLYNAYVKYAQEVDLEFRLFPTRTLAEVNAIFLIYKKTPLNLQDWMVKLRRSPIQDKLNMFFGIWLWSDNATVTIIPTTLSVQNTPLNEMLKPKNSIFAQLSETELRHHFKHLRQTNLI